jgi:hypothetical protein
MQFYVKLLLYNTGLNDCVDFLTSFIHLKFQMNNLGLKEKNENEFKKRTS